MKDKLLKLSEEAVAAIDKAVMSKEFQDTIKAAKIKDTGTFEVIISTEHVDRMQEVIKQDGWQLERFMKNPVVLWGHDYKQLPIGIATELSITTFEGEPALKAVGKFADHEFAQTIRSLYDQKIIRSTSVGFIPKKFDENDMDVITVSELLEFSFVSVPANPFALSTLNEVGYNQAQVGDLFVKGILNADVKDTEDEEVPAEEKPTEEVAEDVETKPDEETEVAEEVATDEEEAPEKDDEEEEDEEKSTEEVSEKGAVEDEQEAQEAREKKWANFTKVDDIIFSFWKVYMDSDTPVADFNKLLAESIGLLQEVHGGDVKSIEEALKDIDDSGMRSVRENTEVFKTLDITTLKSITLALEALIPVSKQDDEVEGGKDDVEETEETQDPSGKEVKTAIAFLNLRKDLQTIVGIASDSLREAREEAEKHY